jgi:hypothetical protein
LGHTQERGTKRNEQKRDDKNGANKNGTQKRGEQERDTKTERQEWDTKRDEQEWYDEGNYKYNCRPFLGHLVHVLFERSFHPVLVYAYFGLPLFLF